MKKVLTILLAVAMVLGSFSMVFAAPKTSSSFSDAGDITYKEAVDVMVATGVIDGMTDGTFQPTGDVTRAQMAKMIATIMSGGEDVGNVYKGACTFADSKDHWAAGYIAYCASKGIIAGRNADTFDPNANVTFTEAAKMILVALGYDSDIEGYVGANWKVNILADAKEAGIFKGQKIADYDKNATREQAAQLLFRGLQAPMVAYAANTAIKIGDVEIKQSTNAAKVANNSNRIDGVNEVLGEKVFDDIQLTKNAAAADNFQRPASRWTTKDGNVGTYASGADYTFVASKAQTLDAAVTAFDADLAWAAAASQGYINGGAGANHALVNVEIGDEVEVYLDNNDEIDSVVIIRWVLDQISDVDTNVSANDSAKGTTKYIVLDKYTGANKYADVKGAAAIQLPGYNASTYVADAYLAVVYTGNNVANPVLATKVVTPAVEAAEVTKMSAGNFFAGDTKYTYVTSVAGNDYDGAGLAIESKYDVYMTGDYVLGAVKVSSATSWNYGMALASGASNNALAATSANQVSMLQADGSAATLTFEAAPNANLDAVGGVGVGGDLQALVAYTLNDDGEVQVAANTFAFVNADNTASVMATNITKGTLAATEVSKKGYVGGNLVSDDVVVFHYKGTTAYPAAANNGAGNAANWTAAAKASNWEVLGKDDILGTKVTGEYLAYKGNIIAIYMTASSALEDNVVIGFFKGATWYDTSATKGYDDITLWVGGEEKTYTTVSGAASLIPGGATTVNAGAGTLPKTAILALTLNTEGKVSAVQLATVNDVVAPNDTLASKNINWYADNAADEVFRDIDKLDGGNVAFDDINGGAYTNVDSAVVYQLYQDTDNAWKLKASKVSSLKKFYNAEVFQFSKSEVIWDTMVFVTDNVDD